MFSARGWLLAAVLAATSSCALETSKAGAACERSTQCAAGLACVKRKCSKDLRSIAATNTVPMLGGGTGGASGSGGTQAGEAGGAQPAESGAGAGAGGEY